MDRPKDYAEIETSVNYDEINTLEELFQLEYNKLSIMEKVTYFIQRYVYLFIILGICAGYIVGNTFPIPRM